MLVQVGYRIHRDRYMIPHAVPQDSAGPRGRQAKTRQYRWRIQDPLLAQGSPFVAVGSCRAIQAADGAAL